MRNFKVLVFVVFMLGWGCSDGQSWVWGQQGNSLKGTGGDGINSAIDFNNNVYIAGGFSDTLIFNPDTLIAGQHTYIAKYDINGNLLWAFQPKGIDRDEGEVATDKAGNVYLAGSYYGYFGNM